MQSDDRVITDIYKKIERERSLIQGAKALRQTSSNADVKKRCDFNIRESLKNIEYLERALQNLQQKRRSQATSTENNDQIVNEKPLPVPRADASNSGLPLPQPPYAKQGMVTKSRPTYTELDLIKYDSPHLGARIQLMLEQLEFKLSVEHQYREGIDKLVKLYQIEGDRRNRALSENQRLESNQKIHILKQALKRYQDMHIDVEEDLEDNISFNSNVRKPLTGRLKISISAIEDVDHAAGHRNRAPDTWVAIKVEDQVRAKTKPSKTDRWTETFDLEVDKANEIEFTVYDRSGDHDVPIAVTWMRIFDIAEELRRKKIELELASSGWVSADQTQDTASQTLGSSTPSNSPDKPFAPTGGNLQQQQQQQQQKSLTGALNQLNLEQDLYVDSWFILEPTGKIRIRVGFFKHNINKRPLEDAGRLGRKGAIRQRKEEVHEMYGHKFVQQQFYNVMRCAFCGEFLKYSSGYQCEDCKYTCHKKCYTKVVTKCISKSSAETDPDEEKINHRIPHRFEPITNISANWCCHCGYILPLGKKSARKCTECGLTCHAHCVHLVPDFCGMSMETANKILETIRNAKSAGQGQAKIKATSAVTQVPGRPTSGVSSKITSSTATDGDRSSVTTFLSRDSVTAASSRPSSTASTVPSATTSTSTAAATAAAAAASAMQKAATPAQTTSPYAAHPYDLSVAAAKPAPLSVTPLAPRSASRAWSDEGAGQGSVKPVGHVPRKAVGTTSSAGGGRSAEKKKVGLDDFNFLAVLGKGNFGKVMLAEAKGSKSLYAIKVLKKEYILENDEVENTISEKRVFLIANKMRHPFLLNLHSCFQTETRVYFVMEYISGGDLMWHIQKEQFSGRRAQFYAAEVLLGLKYFHESGVVYRDLKLDNILLTLDGHIKIADYGLCKLDMWPDGKTGTFCGTPELMAPEILQDQKYGKEVDWWAFGVLIYQMILGQSPFRGDDEQEIFGAILTDEPLYPVHMARNSVSILQQLLTRDPERRLGAGTGDASDVMAHAYFANVNWQDMYHKRVRPPYVPTIDSATDTRNFDQEFTREVPVLTPVSTVLTRADQEQFRGFSHTDMEQL
ncbi:Serine/threonine kinase [Lipomyces japonicus]|uniref:Serine/threonine kinase n=1 Tax=Lipomyces japonicus TaxID=56871 RepID=UPI0034CE3CFA